MTTPRPKVSVVMPLYNGERFLREAIDSILEQTFTGFEFIIVNDGSTDRSREIVESYDDPRIVLINNEKNLKIVGALNRGLEEAKGEYIARQDADDASLPLRFERQVDFLGDHPEIAMVGTSFNLVDEEGMVVKVAHTPVRDVDIRREIQLQNVFGHGTVMMRREAVAAAGGYRGDFRHNEDLNLWRRILKSHQGANLPEILYRWRVNPEGISHQNTESQTEDGRKLLTLVRSELPCPASSASEIRKGAVLYRSHGRGAYRHYLATQFRLAAYLLRRGHLEAALQSVAGAVTADPLVTIHFMYRGARRVAGKVKRKMFR